jgi:hypothetical protein
MRKLGVYVCGLDCGLWKPKPYVFEEMAVDIQRFQIVFMQTRFLE